MGRKSHMSGCKLLLLKRQRSQHVVFARGRRSQSRWRKVEWTWIRKLHGKFHGQEKSDEWLQSSPAQTTTVTHVVFARGRRSQSRWRKVEWKWVKKLQWKVPDKRKQGSKSQMSGWNLLLLKRQRLHMSFRETYRSKTLIEACSLPSCSPGRNT